MSEAEFYSAGSPATAKRYKYVFLGYDALDRLQGGDFSSWNGSGWNTTAAHDMGKTAYDAHSPDVRMRMTANAT